MSVDLPTRCDSRVERDTQAPAPPRPAALGPRIVALVGFVLVVAGVGLTNPVLVLGGLVMAASGLLMRWLAWDLAIPAGVAALLTGSTLVGLAAAFLGVNLLAQPWIVAAVFIAGAAVATLGAGRPGAHLVTRPAPAGGSGWAGYVPAVLAAAIGLAQGFSDRMPVSWGFLATDLAQHMISVQDIQRAGALDYSASGYPRAVHLLAALVSVPGAPDDRTSALLAYDMRLVTALAWLSLALLLWTGTTLALRLGAALRLPRLVAVSAAVLFGAAVLLTDTFVLVFVYMGAAPSLIAVVVIWALPVAALALRDRTVRILGVPLLAAMAVMLLAHLWQTLVVVPLLAIAVYALPRIPPALALLRRPRRLGPPRRTAVVVVASLAMLALGSIPVLSIQRAGGVALASTPGTIPPPPWLVLTLAPVAVGWLLWRCRRGWSRLWVGSLVGLLVAAALMLRGAGHGIDVTQYYPLKVLWFFAIVLGPVLALGAADLAWILLGPPWRALARSGRYTRVSRSALVTCLTGLVVALWLAVPLDHGSSTLRSLAGDSRSNITSAEARSGRASAERFDIAMQYGTRYSPAVTIPVAVGLDRPADHYGPYIVSKLIGFQTGQAQSRGAVGSVCSDVARVGGPAGAVVITQMDVRTLRAAMTKQGCGDVRVVRVPGGLPGDATALPHHSPG